MSLRRKRHSILMKEKNMHRKFTAIILVLLMIAGTIGYSPATALADGNATAAATEEGVRTMCESGDIDITDKITDANLRQVILDRLGKTTISVNDMLEISTLDGSSKEIASLSGLEYATNLENLNLSGNSISDISPLAGLTKLTNLNLSNNNIADISPLSELVNLTDLDLSSNPISDISPLVKITVKTDKGYVITATAGAGGSISPSGTISVDEGGSVTVTITPDAGYRLVSVEVDGVDKGAISTFTFNDVVAPHTIHAEFELIDDSADITDKITDANLRQAIRTRLKKDSGPITAADMLSITNLAVWNSGISDLSGLEYAANLEELHLSSNDISDISPLSGLTKLTELDLGKNAVSNISALSSLTNLEELFISKNDISDISPLSGLTKLIKLELSRNDISDISALSSLMNLAALDLGKNTISDISALSSLTNLTNLYLKDNAISDISDLSVLSKLEYLDLGGNAVSDISSLSSLTNLIGLSVQENTIRDISPLAGLTELHDLDVAENNISDISVLETLTANREYFFLNLLHNYLNLTEGSKTMNTINAISGDVKNFYYDEQKPLSGTPFEAKAMAKGASIVDIPWDYMPDTVYEVTRTGGGETKNITLPSNTSTVYTDTDVKPGTEYSYVIKAHIWQGEGSDPVTIQKTVALKTGADHAPRTLTDSPTNISVSGNISEGAVLIVEDLALGSSPADDAIGERMQDKDYVFILGRNISLSGSFTGALTISLPVGVQYNGQTVTILHAKRDGSLETYTVKVQDGKATFDVTSFSPFAVFIKDGLDDIPKTGDTGAAFIWWLLLAVSVTCIAALVLVRKKAIRQLL